MDCFSERIFESKFTVALTLAMIARRAAEALGLWDKPLRDEGIAHVGPYPPNSRFCEGRADLGTPKWS